MVPLVRSSTYSRGLASYRRAEVSAIHTDSRKVRVGRHCERCGQGAQQAPRSWRSVVHRREPARCREVGTVAGGTLLGGSSRVARPQSVCLQVPPLCAADAHGTGCSTGIQFGRRAEHVGLRRQRASRQPITGSPAVSMTPKPPTAALPETLTAERVSNRQYLWIKILTRPPFRSFRRGVRRVCRSRMLRRHERVRPGAAR